MRREADYRSTCGWMAWDLTLPKRLERPDHAATIAGYLLFCPGAHAFLSWWMTSVIHLRDIPGVPPAKIIVPGATHEILCVTINPERCPDPDPEHTEDFHYLRPIDQAVQFIAPSDAAATAVLAALVNRIVIGDISPDSDYRSVWQKYIQLKSAAARGESL